MISRSPAWTGIAPFAPGLRGAAAARGASPDDESATAPFHRVKFVGRALDEAWQAQAGAPVAPGRDRFALVLGLDEGGGLDRVLVHHTHAVEEPAFALLHADGEAFPGDAGRGGFGKCGHGTSEGAAFLTAILPPPSRPKP